MKKKVTSPSQPFNAALSSEIASEIIPTILALYAEADIIAAVKVTINALRLTNYFFFCPIHF